jgi:hypothetical protein
VAVGSSATWLNLDMQEFERRFPGTRAYNAAPCALSIGQTAYYADVLLGHTPRLRTVLTVVAPRDFEACPPDQTAFFDADLARAYLSGTVPAWLPYVTGFRPTYLAREALNLWRNRWRERPEPVADAHGSVFLVEPGAWRPPLRIDPRCYAGLAALEAAAAARGARLVVATVPVMPEWAAAHDPDGGGVEAWTRGLAAALRRPESLLVDGRALRWGDERFADAVHVLYPNHTPFTRFVADALAARRAAEAGVAPAGGTGSR